MSTITIRKRNWWERLLYSPKLFVKLFVVGRHYVPLRDRLYASIIFTFLFVKGV